MAMLVLLEIFVFIIVSFIEIESIFNIYMRLPRKQS